MGWSAVERANLSRLRHEGIVAVRYEAKGCDVSLEVLPRCIAKGGNYAFSPYSATESITATDAQQLHTALPLGAARLEGKLENGHALRADRRMVGMVALSAAASFSQRDLEGPDCGRATHVVSAVYLGAFAIEAGDKQAIAAAASFFGAGASGSTGRATERLEAEGDPHACDLGLGELKEHPLCAVPLRVSLVPVDPTEKTTSCPIGLHLDPKRGCISNELTEIDKSIRSTRDKINVLRGRVDGLTLHLAECKQTASPREGYQKALDVARASLHVYDAELSRITTEANQLEGERAKVSHDILPLEKRALTLDGLVDRTEQELKYTSIGIVLCQR